MASLDAGGTSPRPGTAPRPGASVVTKASEGLSRRAEALLVTVAAALVTVLTNVEQVKTLTTTVPGDLGDPLYFAWQLAWVGHAVRTDPGSFWTTNAFSGATDNLAYTDTILGYLPLAWLVPNGQAGALAQLNLAGLISTALAIMAAYLLARVLGARVPGALISAAGYGFASWRLTHVIHLNVVSNAGIALTLALLALGHGWSLRDGWRPDQLRPGWAFAAWVVACWQLTFGFAIGIWFVYTCALAMAALTLGWLSRGRHRPDGSLSALGRPGRQVILADAAGGLLFLGWLWLLLQPYLRVLAAHPESLRSESMLGLFSPPWRGLITPSSNAWFSAFWQPNWRDSLTWPPEMLMSPGLLLAAAAVIGLFYSSWGVTRRLTVAGITAVLIVLSLGTAFIDQGAWTYLPLYHHLPGWNNLRTPGRLMIWATIGLCLLAAGAVSRVGDTLARDWQLREGTALQRRGMRHGYLSGRSPVAAAGVALSLALPALLVLAEGVNRTPHPPVSRPPIALAPLAQPVLLLPSDLIGDYHMMLWSTQGWPTIANGNSGFDSAQQAGMRADAARFPDADSVAALRSRGIATVVVIRSRVSPGAWDGAADAPVDGLGITRTDTGDAVVFDLG